MRVAILTGSPNPWVARALERLAALPGITIAGIVLDQGFVARRQKWRNLRRNLRDEGVAYFARRAAETVTARLDRLTRFCDPEAVDALLRKAFPAECFSVRDAAVQREIPVTEVDTLNGPAGREALAALDADLGIVLGTRVLKRATFGIPRRGCINVHKGKVPEYRGMPVGFWELYDGAAAAGVTIHFVDDGLDTGDIVAAGETAIHEKETLDSLRWKLDELSLDLLARAVREIATGEARPQPQPKSTGKARTKPTHAQVRELAARRPHLANLVPRPFYQLGKTLAYCGLYFLGAFALARALHGQRRARILLYHRVEDRAPDPLTVTRRRFAEHLLTLARYYEVRPTHWLVERLAARQPAGRAVCVHFDDCYASVADAAAPLLAAAGLPGMSFVSSGYLDTDRKFPHDRLKYPLDYANMTAVQVRGLEAAKVEVGAHTVNHVDLGAVTLAEAEQEMAGSKADLERILERPVLLFSFPYGRPGNFRAEYRTLAARAGFTAVFSAHGGLAGPDTDLYDIPRIGVGNAHRPLDLLMELEGLSFGAVSKLLRGLAGRAA